MQLFKENIHFLRCWKSHQLGVVQDKFPCRTWTRGDLQNFVFMQSLWTISKCNHSDEHIYYSGSTAGLPDTGCDPDFVVLAPFFLSIGYSWLREVRMHMELVNITYGCIWNINHTSMQNWISTSIKSIISEVFSLHGRS